MSDLGTINYVNENQGTQRIDRTAEAKALGQVGQVAVKVANEAIKADVTNDMVDSLNEAVENAQAVEVVEPVAWAEGTREAYLANRMDRLQSVIQQGKHSQVTAAENQIKTIMAEAQAKYPWLYDDLQRRAKQVIQGSVQMSKLGTADAVASANAKEAQNAYKQIIDHATTSWDKGGLGMNAALDPSHPAWIREYNDRQALRDNEERSARLTGAALANANITLNNPDSIVVLRETLQGDISNMRKMYTDTMSATGWYEVLSRVGSEKAEDIQYVAQWNEQQKPLLLQQLRMQAAEQRNLLQTSGNYDPNMWLTDQGKQYKAMWDDAVSEIDQVIELITATGDDFPSAAAQVERIMAVRGMNTFNGLDEPHKQFLAWSNGPARGMLENVAALKTAEGVKLLDNYAYTARTMMSAASDLWAENPTNITPLPGRSTPGMQAAAAFNSTGALQIPPGANGTTVRQAIRARFADPNASWVVPTSTEMDQHVASLQNMELHRSLFDQVEQTVDGASPEYASDVLLGMTYSLVYKNGAMTEPANLEQATLNILADPSMSRVLDAAGQGPKRAAFAAEAEEFYVRTEPSRRRGAAGDLYRNTVLANTYNSKITVADVALVSEAALNEGEFNWEIDGAKLKEAAKASAATGVGFMTSEADVQREMRKLETKVRETMDQIKAEVDNQINIEMNIAKAKGTVRPMTYKAFFEGEGDPAANEQGYWYDLFNYKAASSNAN